MKLYYVPAACSLSVQIALHEAGVPHEIEKVDGKKKKTADGGDYLAINPRGQVPALVLDDGSLLTEGPAIVQYIADMKPEKNLSPPAGTMAHYRFLEWLNYLTSELHQRFYPLFVFPQFPEEVVETLKQDLAKRFAFISAKLGDKAYLLGDQFTVADGYLFTMLRWPDFVKADLSTWPNLIAFRERIAARPAVQAAMRAAGLIKA